MSVQGDYNNILRCTFVLYQSLEAAINEKQPILCSSPLTSSIYTNPFGALDHTYPELSVAIATIVHTLFRGGKGGQNPSGMLKIDTIICLQLSKVENYSRNVGDEEHQN